MDVTERIYRHNAGRDPDLVARKYARIASDPFLFLRGTCHLFYEDWNGGRELDAAPRSWICGDLHLENLGSYKGDNRLAYFDLNDFDEAALAPCTWETARFLVSLHVAGRSLALSLREVRALCRCFLDAYIAALATGKARWIERSIAQGMIGRLLDQVASRKRRSFLDRHTLRDGKRRSFVIDDDRLFAVAAHDRDALFAWFERFASRQEDAKFFRPIDVARRAAGTGSLGLRRYAVLVRGNGSPNGNYLLDLKPAGESAAGRRLTRLQPRWQNDAQRVVAIQQRMQAIAPAFLMPVRFAGHDWVLKELQPSRDRLDLAAVHGQAAPLSDAIGSMGRLVAWSSLRSSGRQGSARADDFVAFASARDFIKPLVAYVEEYAAKVMGDWRAFRSAWQEAEAKRISPARSARASRSRT
jgi:uncharacterized protein (DUF2252 family)